MPPSKTKQPEAQASLLDVQPQPNKLGQAVAVSAPPKAGKPAAPRSGPPRAATTNDLLNVLVSAATDKAVDASKLRELWEIHKDVSAENARLAFVRDFHEMAPKLPVINKDGRIEIRERGAGGERNGRVQQSTPYATFDAIDDAVAPILYVHGFAISFSTDAGPDGKLLVKGMLQHVDGHARETVFPLPAETSGSKNNVQGYGSSLQYGKRYAMIALLKIRSKAMADLDDDGVQAGIGKRLTTKQVNDLEKAMAFKSVSLERVAKYCATKGVEIVQLGDVPATMFDEIISLVKQAT